MTALMYRSLALIARLSYLRARGTQAGTDLQLVIAEINRRRRDPKRRTPNDIVEYMRQINAALARSLREKTGNE